MESCCRLGVGRLNFFLRGHRGIADGPVTLLGTVSNLSWSKVRQLRMEALGVVELDPGANPCDSMISIAQRRPDSQCGLNVRVIVTGVGSQVRLGNVAVPWVFLGICLDFHYFSTGMVFPKLGFDFSQGAVAQALVEP